LKHSLTQFVTFWCFTRQIRIKRGLRAEDVIFFVRPGQARHHLSTKPRSYMAAHKNNASVNDTWQFCFFSYKILSTVLWHCSVCCHGGAFMMVVVF